MNTPGKIAYDAYCKEAGGKSLISGDSLPAFEILPAKIRQCWEVAASAATQSRS